MAGYLTAWLVVRVLNEQLSVGAPDTTYFAFLALGFALALLILQLARRAVRSEGEIATRMD